MNHNGNGKLVPALIGGLVGGVLSVVPIVSALNCLCCSLVVAGGMIAGAMYSRRAVPGQLVTYGDGALVGLLAGLVTGVVYSVLSIPLYLLGGVSIQSGFEEALAQVRNNPDVPPEVIEMLERFASSEGMGLAAVLGFFLVAWLLFAIFATIGGCLGVAIFKRPDTPAPPPPTGYTAPPPPQ